MSTSTKPREATLLDVRLASAWREAGELADSIHKNVRAALDEIPYPKKEVNVLSKLFNQAKAIEQELAALIESRGSVESE